MNNETQPEVIVRNLTVEFLSKTGTVRALDDVSLDINPGETVGIVGQSGSGKSVLIRSLVNFVPKPGRIKQGAITINGQDVLALPPAQLRSLRGRNVGIIVQNARVHLNPVISVGRQIANVYLAHHDTTRRDAWERATEMLSAVGIPDPKERMRSYAHEMSGGMVQRVVIAMALVCRPGVVLADEPTSGLDVTIQDQVLRLFRSLVSKTGASALLVTRDMGIVANFCDRVGVMDNGRLIEVVRVADIFSGAVQPQTKALLAAASLNEKQVF
jgi:ABC-type dipeptide/oligopeptide/nickel transport system ATPase component